MWTYGKAFRFLFWIGGIGGLVSVFAAAVKLSQSAG